jgi:hypothetical protein
VPIRFPAEIKGQRRKIYNQIAQNPFKDGGGLVSLVLSFQDAVSLRIRDQDYTGALGLAFSAP